MTVRFVSILLILLLTPTITVAMGDPFNIPTETDISSLVKNIESADPTIRKNTIFQLGLLGVRAETAIPALIKALCDEDAEIRTKAAWALCQMDPHPEEAISTLIDCLCHDDRDIRREAILIIGDVGPDAIEALPHLEEILTDVDEDMELSRLAMYAISYMTDDATELEEILFPLLRANKISFVDDAVYTLCRLGLKSPDFIDYLIDLVKNGDIPLQRCGIIGLGRVGRPAKNAIPLLLEIYNNRDDNLRQCVIDAIPLISSCPDVCNMLLEAFDDPDRQIQESAIIGLSHLWPTRKIVINRLIEKLSSFPGYPLDDEIIDALGIIGPDATEAIPILIEYFFLGTDYPSGHVIYALGEIGPDANDAIPLLIKALDVEPNFMDAGWLHGTIAFTFTKMGPAAREALFKIQEVIDSDIGPEKAAFYYSREAIKGDTKRALPYVIEMLENDTSGCQQSALWVIYELGPDAADAVDILVEKFWDFFFTIQGSLIDALGAIGPAASPALDDLRLISRVYPTFKIDEYSCIRRLAREAIAKIEGTWEGEES